MKGRRLIVSDIHGRYRALRQVLERAEFDDSKDTLYSVGDFCDRGNGNLNVLLFLSSLNQLRSVLGNHDAWLQDYLSLGTEDENWLYNNGGIKTLNEIRNISRDKKKELSRWLNLIPYVRSGDSFLIVHGGPVKGESVSALRHKAQKRDWKMTPSFREVPDELWDRKYLSSAVLWEERRAEGMKFEEFLREVEVGEKNQSSYFTKPISTRRTIFIGHSIVGDKPFSSEEYHLVALDTGAASPSGYLTVMDIDTRQYWQSDRIDRVEEI